MKSRFTFLRCTMIFAALILLCATAQAQAKKPNILVIWGDDIGMWNVGAYTHGMMGRTPHIDSFAKQGATVSTLGQLMWMTRPWTRSLAASASRRSRRWAN